MTLKRLKISFGASAEKLVDNGYEPLPLASGKKHPIVKDWNNQDLCNPEVTKHHIETYSAAGVGLRCGSLVAIDIDVKDPAASHAIRELAIEHLGETPLIRFGKRPKQALLYLESLDGRRHKTSCFHKSNNFRRLAAF